eukprot:scaffold11394_cov183-Amphora_coffeaeformis.AAC.13
MEIEHAMAKHILVMTRTVLRVLIDGVDDDDDATTTIASTSFFTDDDNYDVMMCEVAIAPHQYGRDDDGVRLRGETNYTFKR